MERLAGRIILLWGWRRVLAAFAAGALLVLAQAPYDFFAVGFVSFPVLVWLIDGATPPPGAGWLARLRPAFATGWWFGFGYFLAGLWWIGNALLFQADSFAWALPLAVAGIPAVLALFYAAAAVFARLLWSDGPGRIFALAFGFGIAEWLRTFLFTGFPWNAIGYAAMPLPILMQSAAVVGLVGMNALAVLVFAMPALLARPAEARLGLALALGLCMAHVGFGFWRLPSRDVGPADALQVRIVQPAVPMDLKWDAAEEDRVFAQLVELSSAEPGEGVPRPELIVWPETAVPFLLTERPDALAALGAALADGQMLLTGAVRSEGAGAAYTNAVMAIDSRGEIVGAVDKVHLVPFGEYVPLAGLLDRFGISQFVAGPMNFTAGTARHPLELPGGARVAAFICYEVIFPAEVVIDVASANIIVNVTNDAWFGRSPGPYQHFRQAQLRAVEAGLPLVRAANNGLSGATDAYGRIIDAFDLDARGEIDVRVPYGRAAVAAAATPGTVGLGVVAALGLVAGAVGLRRRMRSN
jgi:apolipoprotein N-acyltransferase